MIASVVLRVAEATGQHRRNSRRPRGKSVRAGRRPIEPLIITQNGEAKAVLQDLASYEETQETLALLKLLALGQQDVEAGRVEAGG